MQAHGGGFRHSIDTPDSGYVAIFGEGVFAAEAWPMYLSTTVRILGAEENQAPSNK